MSAPIGDPVLAVAVRAARRAAAVIVDAARDLKRLPAHAKEHGDIAANADAEAENAIIATLRAAFPEHAILGAESGEIVGQLPDTDAPGGKGGFRWLIDAVDGTVNFVHGYPYYAVSIALTRGTEVTHAAVLDPVRDEMFTAVRGKGAQMDGTPLRVSACLELEQALIGTVFPQRDSPRLPAYLPTLHAVVAHCAGVRRGGAGALDLCYLAAGRLDGFWVTSLKPWDIAAGALIVKEAGGRVGDFAGGADFLRSSEVVAAAPGVFNRLRETVAAAHTRA